MMTEFILIVDDEKELAAVIAEYLEIRGFKTIVAHDGKEGYKKARNQKFSGIITDFRMPGLNGSDLITALRANEHNEHTPVILISGHTEEANEQIKKSGLKDIRILAKPINLKILEQWMEELGFKGKVPLPENKIDVNFLNPFIEASMEVFKTMAQVEDLKPGAIALLKSPDDLKYEISGVVALVSKSFRGSICLCMPEKTFVQILNKMLDENYTGVTDANQDAIAELLNIIVGKAKSLLSAQNLEVNRAIPNVVRGKDLFIANDGLKKSIHIPFKSSAGAFSILIMVNHFPGL